MTALTKWDEELSLLGPTAIEQQLTADMPSPMAIGYIKARRKDHPVAESGLGDILGGIFGRGA